MAWQRYDIVIDDRHFRSGTKAFETDKLEEVKVIKENKVDWIPFLLYGLAAVLAYVCAQRFSNMPYETDMMPFTNFRFVVLLGLGALIAGYVGHQRSLRPSEITYRLVAKMGNQSIILYSHSDKKIVEEINLALSSAVRKRKR